jgi:hypothetical protein
MSSKLILAPEKAVRDHVGTLLTERFREGIAGQRAEAASEDAPRKRLRWRRLLSGLRTQANKRSA